MNKLPRAIAMALGIFGFAATVHAGSIGFAGGRYLVVFKSDVLPADAQARIARNGGTVTRAFDQIGVVSVSGDAAFVKRMRRTRKYFGRHRAGLQSA